MRLEHYEKGIQYTADDLLLVARKMGKLATYCSRLKDEASVIRVEAEKRETKKSSDEIKVMITVELPKKLLRAESRKSTLREAIDRCSEKLEPQLVKYKEMRTAKGRARRASSAS